MDPRPTMTRLAFSLPGTRFLLALLGAGLALAAPMADALGDTTVSARVALSAEEQAFVESHSHVRVVMPVDHPPFSVYRGGEGRGFEHDLLRLISDKTGLTFEKSYAVWSEALRRFRRGKVDMIASISYRANRRPFTLYTEPYYRIPVFVFVRNDFGRYRGVEDLDGARVGIIRDIFYEADLVDIANIELHRFDTYQELTRALVLGEVDALVQNLTNIDHLIKRQAFSDIRIAGELGVPGLVEEDFRFGITPGTPTLQAIVQKGLDAITVAEWEALTAQWLDGDGDTNGPAPGLTEEERAYLRTQGPIDICIDPNWMPFERFNEAGDFEGISADYFALFARTLGTAFRPVITETWTESVEALNTGRCDLFSLAMPTPERETYLDFTDSYIETPLVIATQADVAFLNGLADLKGRTIAIPALYAFAELLREDYPELDLVEVTDIDAGLDLVRDGKVFGYIGTLATIGYKLQTKYTGELRVTGDTGRSWDMGVAVREDKPMLFAIMQKAVESLTAEQKRGINDKWIAVRYEERTDYTLLLWVIALFVLVMLIGAVLYLKQAGLRKQLQAAYHQAERLAVTDKLTGVYNRHRLDETLAEETRKAERYDGGFGVIILDIDHFKHVNDRFGHRIGDLVLQTVVEVLQRHCRRSDVLGRWGGEEFLIVAPNADKATLLAFAEKLRAAIEAEPFSDVDHITTSIGASRYERGDNPDTLVKRADDALYDAKRRGRNRVAFR